MSLNRLTSLFGAGALGKAFEILDNKKIVEVRTETANRSFFKIKGTYHEEYVVLFPGIVCNCQAFGNSIGKNDLYLVSDF